MTMMASTTATIFARRWAGSAGSFRRPSRVMQLFGRMPDDSLRAGGAARRSRTIQALAMDLSSHTEGPQPAGETEHGSPCGRRRARHHPASGARDVRLRRADRAGGGGARSAHRARRRGRRHRDPLCRCHRPARGDEPRGSARAAPCRTIASWSRRRTRMAVRSACRGGSVRRPMPPGLPGSRMPASPPLIARCSDQVPATARSVARRRPASRGTGAIPAGRWTMCCRCCASMRATGDRSPPSSPMRAIPSCWDRTICPGRPTIQGSCAR